MKRPSFQFYPGDWAGNSNLRRCSHAEKGVWLDVMCLMHDQADYGVLRWPLVEIAQAVGCKAADLKALVRKGVLKGDDKHLTEPCIYTPRSGRKDGEPVTLLAAQEGPVWYSSRMVRDEYVRGTRGESTRFGDDEDAPKRAPKASPKGGFGEGKSVASKPPPMVAPKPPFGDGSSSSSSSSSSSIGIPTDVAKDKNSVCDGLHTQISDEFKTHIRTARPELDAGLVFANFVSHYPSEKRTFAKWQQWVANERTGVAEAAQAAAQDPETRPNVEKRGVAVGIGKWDDGREQWPQYKARVVAAERQAVAA